MTDSGNVDVYVSAADRELLHQWATAQQELGLLQTGAVQIGGNGTFFLRATTALAHVGAVITSAYSTGLSISAMAGPAD